MLFLSSYGGAKTSGTSKGGDGSSIFGSKKDPVDLAKEWKRNLQKEARNVDRDILKIKREEERALKECKSLVKAKHVAAAKVLARQIVETRKTIEKMYVTKAHLNSVSNNLQTSVSMLKLQGCLAKSADIMGSMNKLVSVKEISETMNSMAREMEKVGLIDEIITESMESLETEDIDSQAAQEVEKVILELTTGLLSPAGSAPSTSLAGKSKGETVQNNATPTETDTETEDLMRRLQAL